MQSVQKGDRRIAGASRERVDPVVLGFVRDRHRFRTSNGSVPLPANEHGEEV